MDFVFMLTRNDETVPDCLDVLGAVASVGLTHIGFKDVGVSDTVLTELAGRIHAMGAVSHLEVVSTSREDCLRAARVARDLGVQRLLGGTLVDETLRLLDGKKTAYLPFPGRPFDHPTRLGGSPGDVESDCRAFAARGCAGVDLLAYRATEADPLDLVRAARRGTPGYLLVAGSVSTTTQIRALRDAGVDGITVGSAAFEGTFVPGAPLTEQLRAIVDACR